MERARLGDYVIAFAPRKGQVDDVLEGVFIRDNGDGTILVQNKFCRGPYTCRGPEVETIIPDNKLHGDWLEFVHAQRRNLGLPDVARHPTSSSPPRRSSFRRNLISLSLVLLGLIGVFAFAWRLHTGLQRPVVFRDPSLVKESEYTPRLGYGKIVEGPVAISGSLAVIRVELKDGEPRSRVGALVSAADGYAVGDTVQIRFVEVYNHVGMVYTDIRVAEKMKTPHP